MLSQENPGESATTTIRARLFRAVGLAVFLGLSAQAQDPPAAIPDDVDRSPVDLAISGDGRFLVTANQTSGSLSLIDLSLQAVVDEVSCGEHPAAITMAADGSLVLATASFSGELFGFAIRDGKLKRLDGARLGFAPMGIAIRESNGDRLAYVALADAGAVAVVDVDAWRLKSSIEVGRWPRYLAITPDGSRLAVGLSGDRGVAIIDTKRGEVLYREIFSALNLGQMCSSRDGRYVYLPWVTYGANPISPQNIRRGWVIASRIARVRTDGPARREAMALDKRGEAVGDPHGLALSPDEAWLVASASGSHELLVFRTAGLPLVDFGGPGDTMDQRLASDSSRFFRIALGGRPMAVRFAPDGRRVYVANYLANAVQAVDLEERRVIATVPLGGPGEPSLARQGEAIFYDARRSLDQWYSCHTCHYEGGTNAVKMDTTNDGGFGTFKTVLDLHHVADTGPWTWHGWQKDVRAALAKSLTETMLGPEPSETDLDALIAFFKMLPEPPNPHRLSDGSLTPAAERGKQIFQNEGACASCHAGPFFTDGQIHDVGLGSAADRYDGFNTPSLAGVHRRIRLLHDGRANNLEEVLKGPHEPSGVRGARLNARQLADLIEYVKSL